MKTALTALTLVALLLPLNAGAQETPGLKQAVDLYRQGQYLEAESALTRLHAQKPEDSVVTYYLAMTAAQLGRWEQARGLYETVILLDPNGKTAELARQGLSYLPARTAENLDLPPRFERLEPTAGVVAAPPATPHNGMSPQDLMMMQMMMGGQQGGGMNPMLFGLMSQQQPGAEGGMMNNMDPNVMSTLMMNQMMQNFNLMGGDDNDR